jgi:hypothetical protein
VETVLAAALASYEKDGVKLCYKGRKICAAQIFYIIENVTTPDSRLAKRTF